MGEKHTTHKLNARTEHCMKMHAPRHQSSRKSQCSFGEETEQIAAGTQTSAEGCLLVWTQHRAGCGPYEQVRVEVVGDAVKTLAAAAAAAVAVAVYKTAAEMKETTGMPALVGKKTSGTFLPLLCGCLVTATKAKKMATWWYLHRPQHHQHHHHHHHHHHIAAAAAGVQAFGGHAISAPLHGRASSMCHVLSQLLS